MKEVIARDKNGKEIKRGDTVRLVGVPEGTHKRLVVGRLYKVSSWQDRTFGASEYICVFLQTKKGGNTITQGVQDRDLEVVSE